MSDWGSALSESMPSLRELTQHVSMLNGRSIAMDVVQTAVLDALPDAARGTLLHAFDARVASARSSIVRAAMPGEVLSAFERDIERARVLLAQAEGKGPAAGVSNAAETVLFTTTRISTFLGTRSLSGASGFFFRRGQSLFLVTSRHVLADQPSNHLPDRIEIELHTHVLDLTRYAVFSMPLYRDGLALWRQAEDSGGDVDVAAIEIDIDRLPHACFLEAFGLEHLASPTDAAQIGDPLVVVGFPLGFHDTMHHLPVVRGACIASAYGVRFQQKGYFLTDARTHRGSSGAPVVWRSESLRVDGSRLPWRLLGVHSTRMDMRTRDFSQDESLGLNCAWYTDILAVLTEPPRMAKA